MNTLSQTELYDIGKDVDEIMRVLAMPVPRYASITVELARWAEMHGVMIELRQWSITEAYRVRIGTAIATGPTLMEALQKLRLAIGNSTVQQREHCR